MANDFSERTQGSPAQKSETLIRRLVRFLVMGAAFIVAAGGVLSFIRTRAVSQDYHLFKSEPVSLRSLHGILGGAASLDGLNLIQLGILLLIAIPIIRVLAFLVTYLLQRDWIYSVIALTVLGLLLFSLLGNGI
jgi:uncharacterized membrane protein